MRIQLVDHYYSILRLTVKNFFHSYRLVRSEHMALLKTLHCIVIKEESILCLRSVTYGTEVIGFGEKSLGASN